MTADQYIKELHKLKNLAVDQFGNLSKVEDDLVDQALEWLATNMDVKKGEFVITPDLVQQMNRFVVAVTSILNTNEDYQGMVADYLVNVETIGKNLLEFQSTANDIDLVKAGLKPIQQAVINGLIDDYTGNGLNVGFAAPLKDIIHRNVLAGMNLREAKQYLSDYIIAGKDESGKLSRYLTQTAQQGVDSYTGAMNARLYQTFAFTGFIMSGSLIDTSSLQCIAGITEGKATGGYLTNAQIDALLVIARNNKSAQLIDGTTRENLDINKFHWGCRHEFTPMIRKSA